MNHSLNPHANQLCSSMANGQARMESPIDCVKARLLEQVVFAEARLEVPTQNERDVVQAEAEGARRVVDRWPRTKDETSRAPFSLDIEGRLVAGAQRARQYAPRSLAPATVGNPFHDDLRGELETARRRRRRRGGSSQTRTYNTSGPARVSADPVPICDFSLFLKSATYEGDGVAVANKLRESGASTLRTSRSSPV